MLSLGEVFLRLTVAAALGAIIGIERDLRRRPAGIRTSFFVCLATALFTILSGEISRLLGDTGSTRIASNIVQGVGFLGAGAILRESGGRVGMTTAATIFVEAAIGMAAGGGLFAVATYATVLVLFGLVCLGWLAQRFDLKCRPMVFRFTTSHAENVALEVQRLMAQMKVPMQHFRVSMAGENSIVEFEAVVSHSQQESIVVQLNRQGVMTEMTAVEGSRE
ncbi:MAG TPA: MgtC/SapB family protein [Candidatus Sulfotelmatobacter sp.]|nr:MgtC/SapB family protein [Candidatus Sulfotelmatobacter sp.]